MVDEESVGSLDFRGCGAKILCGEGALEEYLSQQNRKETVVCVSNLDHAFINLYLLLSLTVIKTSVYYIFCYFSSVYTWIMLLLCNLKFYS